MRLSRIPWQSNGSDPTLSLLRAQVRSLVGELKSHKPRSNGKKKKRNETLDDLSGKLKAPYISLIKQLQINSPLPLIFLLVTFHCIYDVVGFKMQYYFRNHQERQSTDN